MRRIKDIIKGYFTFNRTEQRGIAVLLVLVLIVILINILLPYLITEEKPDYSQFKKEIADFEASQQKAKKEELREKHSNSKENKKFAIKLHPFPFDPNGLPVKKWEELGLTDKQIAVIKNYEKKGGQFCKKEDLARIYTISDEEYKILKPYIRIENLSETEIIEPENTIAIQPFPFDPNRLEKKEWLKMGLREKLVNTILKYRDKGGRFYKKDDLKNIYGMKPEEFTILKPFIEIERDTAVFLYTHKHDSVIVEINSADTLDLQQLKGIGPSFASRIVKYREMLGGYCSKEQLLEVYGMDSSRYYMIKDNISVNPNSIKRIDINSATIKQLIKHPYIEYYTAKSIVKFRNKIGKYTNVSELKDSSVVYEELYGKIVPYLIVK